MIEPTSNEGVECAYADYECRIGKRQYDQIQKVLSTNVMNVPRMLREFPRVNVRGHPFDVDLIATKPIFENAKTGKVYRESKAVIVGYKYYEYQFYMMVDVHLMDEKIAIPLNLVVPRLYRSKSC